jgi:hypothetical protein
MLSRPRGKINVYLPDDLAAAVRAAGFAVSPVCQQALAEAVRTFAAARKTAEALRDPAFDPGRLPQIGTRNENRMTPRLREAVRIAREVSGPEGLVETRHLLIGLLDEGENLATRLLEGLGVDLDDLRRSATSVHIDEPQAPGTSANGSLWTGLTLPARMAIAAALEASIDLAHNYLGCEHLRSGSSTSPTARPGPPCASAESRRATPAVRSPPHWPATPTPSRRSRPRSPASLTRSCGDWTPSKVASLPRAPEPIPRRARSGGR